MIFVGAMSFVMLYTTNQVLGFGVAVSLAAALIPFGMVHQHTLRITAKDVLYAMYAGAALLATLRYWDPYEFTFYLRVVLYPWAVSAIFQSFRVSWSRIEVWALLVMVVIVVTVGTMLFQESPGQFDVSLNRLLTLDRTRGFYYRGEDRTGPNAAAAMCVVGIAVTLALFKFRRVGAAIAIPVLAVMGVLLIISGGRIATAGALLLVAQYGATSTDGRMPHRLREALASGAMAVVLGVSAIVMYRALAETQGGGFTDRIQGILNPFSDRSFLVRLQDWTQAVRMIQADIWGSGFNAYYNIYGRTPHNEILGQWIGGGWLGVLLYVILCGYVTLRSGAHVLKRLDTSEQSFAHYMALSLLTVTWLTMITEHISRGGMNTFYPVVWMCVGMAHALPVRGGNAATVDAARHPRRWTGAGEVVVTPLSGSA